MINRIGTVVLALGLSLTAQAAVIHDNGAPNQFVGTQMSEFVVAEDFTLAATWNVANIRFWTIQSAASDYSGSTFWAIYADAGGVPDAVVAGGANVAITPAATGLSSVIGYAEYVFDIPVAFQLLAGNYWLGLQNGPLSLVLSTEMLWATTDAGNGTEALYSDRVNGWVGAENQLAFQIEGTLAADAIPEPGSFALLACGLAVAAWLRRRQAS
jgi:PEP-CTERM motif